MSKQIIDLTVDGKDSTFNVSVADYNRFMNNISGKNKVAPAHNLVMQTLDEGSDSAAMLELLKKPGMPFQIAEALIEEVVPDVNVTAKKRKSTAKR